MRQGWECPKCGSVYAPDVEECRRCGPKDVRLDRNPTTPYEIHITDDPAATNTLCAGCLRVTCDGSTPHCLWRTAQ